MAFNFLVEWIFILALLSTIQAKKDKENEESRSMFEIKDEHIGDLKTKVLSNTQTGAIAASYLLLD